MTELDATAERDLASVEDALSAHAVTTRPIQTERELQELALALRAECSPEPDPSFAAALRERVEAGFPSDSPSRGPRPSLPADRRALVCPATCSPAPAWSPRC